MEKKYFSGFTLIELIIALAIIAILAALIISAFTSQLFKGRDAKRKGDIDRIKIAVEEYEKDHNCYPPYDEMTMCGTDPSIAIHPYLNDVPCDPIKKTAYFYEVPADVSCPSWFRIYTLLEYTKDASVTPNIGPYNAFNYVQSSQNAPAIIAGTNTPLPSGSGGIQLSNFYGCKSGTCVQITWDSTRPGPECDPNYSNSTCNGGQCGSPSAPTNECISWH